MIEKATKRRDLIFLRLVINLCSHMSELLCIKMILCHVRPSPRVISIVRR